MKYGYHGTWKTRLGRVQEHGLVPGAPSPFPDEFSRFDDGKHVFFSDDEKLVEEYYGDVVLRFPWPKDAKPDVNVYGRVLPNQFVTKGAIPPKNIEVKVGSVWEILEGYDPTATSQALKRKLLL